jgi:methionyl-tRNA synthetase
VGKYYLTTPIYYVNARPHLGHAYTTIVADALARWHRLLGDDVYFLTGTDPQEFTDSIAPLFEQAWQRLNISHTDFIRTTEQRHKLGVEKLLQACFDAGDIELDTYSGLYCVACEAYFTPEELLGNDCPIHKRPVEHVEEENYFFRLSRFEQRLIDFYSSHPNAVVPDHRVNEVLGFIKQGLQDFSVSRKTLTWGIPLPFDASHVAYVWFDALANYITAIGYGTNDEKFNEWWPVNHHLIGKDIVRFHNVYWPAMLMSAGIEPPRGWAVGGWLLVGGEKMSKTSGNVVNPLDLVDEFGVDGFRYYVLSDTAYGNDGDFTYEGLVSRYNSDLANNLGNLAARVATVVSKKCNGLGTAPDPNSPLAEHSRTAVADTISWWELVQPSRALEATWTLIRATNAHLENHEPWKSEPGAHVDTVMGDALEALRIVTLLAFPAIPDTAREIWRRIGMTTDIEACRIPDDTAWGLYPPGSVVEKGEPLFPRRTLA